MYEVGRWKSKSEVFNGLQVATPLLINHAEDYIEDQSQNDREYYG